MSATRIRYLIVNDRRRGSCKLPSGLFQGRTGPDPTHANYTLEIPDVDTWRHVAQRLAQKYPDRHFWADCQIISQTGEGVAEAPHVMPAASHTAAPEPTHYPTERPAPRPASEPAAKPAAPAAEQKAKPATSAPAADVAADKPAPRPKKDPQAELIAALEARVAAGAKRMSDLAAELAVEAADIQAAVAASATLAVSARAGWVSLKK